MNSQLMSDPSIAPRVRLLDASVVVEVHVEKGLRDRTNPHDDSRVGSVRLPVAGLLANLGSTDMSKVRQALESEQKKQFVEDEFAGWVYLDGGAGGVAAAGARQQQRHGKDGGRRDTGGSSSSRTGPSRSGRKDRFSPLRKQSPTSPESGEFVDAGNTGVTRKGQRSLPLLSSSPRLLRQRGLQQPVGASSAVAFSVAFSVLLSAIFNTVSKHAFASSYSVMRIKARPN